MAGSSRSEYRWIDRWSQEPFRHLSSPAAEILRRVKQFSFPRPIIDSKTNSTGPPLFGVRLKSPPGCGMIAAGKAAERAAGGMEMYRYLLICIAALGLTACMETTGSNTIIGPSGTPVSQAKCPYSPNGCLKEASETCKGPYQVLDSDSHSGGLVADVMAGPVTWYAMTYKCGPSDGKMPTFAFRGQQFVDSPSVVVNTPPAGAAIPPQINCTSRRVGGTVQTTC